MYDVCSNSISETADGTHAVPRMGCIHSPAAKDQRSVRKTSSRTTSFPDAGIISKRRRSITGSKLALAIHKKKMELEANPTQMTLLRFAIRTHGLHNAHTLLTSALERRVLLKFHKLRNGMYRTLHVQTCACLCKAHMHTRADVITDQSTAHTFVQ
jgi:hypothetical protein